MSDAEKYMIRWRGQESGPFAIDEIRERLESLEIGVWHEVHHEGKWKAVEAFLRLMDGGGNAAGTSSKASGALPPLPNEEGGRPVGKTSRMPSRRFRLLYAFLGLTVGPLGIHNFYAFRWKIALVQLGFTIGVYAASKPLLLPYIWCWLEVIIVWQDANKRGMI